MGMTAIDKIEPGMVLAAEAKDRNGKILLNAGAAITEKHLRIFKMWGVHELDIEGVDQAQLAAETLSQIDPAALAEAEERARALFVHCDSANPVVQELLRLCTLRLAGAGKGEA